MDWAREIRGTTSIASPVTPAAWSRSTSSGLRAGAISDGKQHVLGGGQGHALQVDSGLERRAAGMQHETPVRLHRAAEIDRHCLATGGRVDLRAQLLKDIRQVQALRAVDHQPHGTIGRVLDDIGQGVRKVRVGHMGHGDQELMLEVSRRVFFHES